MVCSENTLRHGHRFVQHRPGFFPAPQIVKGIRVVAGCSDRFKRTTRVPRAAAAPAAAPVTAPAAAPVVAPAAAPAGPFAVGATVELHGLVSNPAANGRRVQIVRTPPDFAARGRISVNLDGAVRAVKRENVRAVPGGVGAAPSTAAMAWLTPGFLDYSSLLELERERESLIEPTPR